MRWRDRWRREMELKGPRYPLKSRRNCLERSKNPPPASENVLLLRSTGGDSDLNYFSFFFVLFTFIFIFFPRTSWMESHTSTEPVPWWLLTLREPCAVTLVTQSFKSLSKEKKKKRKEEEGIGGIVYDIALQWAPQKRKISINFTRSPKSGRVCRDDFIVQSARLFWRCERG